VINPNASAVARRIRREELVRMLRGAGAAVDVRLTKTIEELAEVWRQDDGRRLVLVGGDGTIHTAANLGPPQREVALIPAGKANNIARSLGIPLETDAAARLAAQGGPHPIDLIEARSENRRRFVVESVSVGFLAQARVRYHGRNSADLLAGARAGAAALARFHPLAAKVRGPNRTDELRLAQLFVANLPLYEFGLRIAPQARPSDSCMDLVGIEAPSRRAVLRMVRDLRRGTHTRRSDVHAWQATEVDIDTHGLSPIVADSYDLGFGPVKFRVAPAALRLVRPRGSD
jgi:diacylglycerol kinase family enzyme